MNESWVEMHIAVPATGVDLLCSELAELGCSGVTVEERDLDTFVPPDPDEPSTGECLIKAYFAAPQDLPALRQRVQRRLVWLQRVVPGLRAELPATATLGAEDWAEGWKQHFSAVRIGQRLVVKPSWEAFAAGPQDVVVELDPGMAFGTGTHGTTRLCLEALAEIFDSSAPPRRILDVGTGSGILAIAGAALGGERVLACDIEEQACRTARENVRHNGVEEQVEVTDAPLESLEGGFDIVLANILAEENARLAASLAGRLAPGGTLVLSGILQEKEPLVAAAFVPFGLLGPDIRRLEEWSCLLYRKPVSS